jgi:hypothetical protein
MPRIRLNDVEVRLLGVLIEKELTTPEQYPLSLNALRVGSNQKSNREPLVEYGEAEVWVGIQGLESKALIERQKPGVGSRVEHWRHNARQLLNIDRSESAVLAELLLRGAQAPGELRQRASRMHGLDTIASLSFLLERLIAKGLVRRLPAGLGSRVERFTHTLEEAGFKSGSEASSVEEVIAKHDGVPLAEIAASPSPAAPQTGGPGATASAPSRPSMPPTPAPAPASAPATSSPSAYGRPPAFSASLSASAAPQSQRPGSASDAESPRERALRERVERLERQLARLAERLGESLAD